MSPVASHRKGRDGAIRRIAIKRPTIAPPARAPSDSSKVEGMALRRKRNSVVPKLRPIAISRRPAALEHGPIDGAQARSEAERHRQVKAGRYEVELEGSEGGRCQRVGDCG